jgi:hypothetical protein
MTRCCGIAAVLALLSCPLLAEYEMISVGFSSFGVEKESAERGFEKDWKKSFEASVQRPLWGRLGCIWLGADYGRYEGSAGDTTLTSSRARLRLGATVDVLQWVIGSGAAGGRYHLSKSEGAEKLTKNPFTFGWYLNVHRKVWKDAAVFYELGFDSRKDVSLGTSDYELESWQHQVGISWQMPWEWPLL